MPPVRLRPVQWTLKSERPSAVHLLDVDDWYDEHEDAPKTLCGERIHSEIAERLDHSQDLCLKCLNALEPIKRQGGRYELEDGSALLRFDERGRAALAEGPYGKARLKAPRLEADPRSRLSALAA